MKFKTQQLITIGHNGEFHKFDEALVEIESAKYAKIVLYIDMIQDENSYFRFDD